jgi:hypothetical protein
MYTYDFVFYKPGKKFYTQDEVVRMKNSLANRGFEVEGKWRMDEKEKEKIVDIDFDLRKSGQEFFLLLGPAEEDFHGRLGQLSIPREQFEENPKKSADLMIKAANTIFVELKPLFGWGDHELELNRLEQFLRFDKIAALAWVNFLSRELVERLGGLDKVLLFPPNKKEKRIYKEEPWQFTYILTSPSPADEMPLAMGFECQQRYPGAVLRTWGSAKIEEVK